ncbi:hypothetical protein RND81_09G193600 [Saponaria officinalis]|uniref:Protein FAR1-RELATED SEQUENCE n=1 Tax=Saponaria officinalis TaxID=3572 RepID=A0AAW1IP18_SAPOF
MCIWCRAKWVSFYCFDVTDLLFRISEVAADMQIEERFNDTEGCVAEKKFTEVLQGVAREEFCRIVESHFTPFIRQEFLNLEEVVQFYKMYALACGFNVRRYTTKKWRDGTVKSNFWSVTVKALRMLRRSTK